MQQLPPGAMLSVPLSKEKVQTLLNKQLSLAAINGPNSCVVSGAIEAIESFQNDLIERDLECRRLQTSHAFHSDMMEPILEPFTERVKKVKLNPPKIPYLSNVTGTWITAAETTDPHYWARHLRQTVHFSSGLQQLLKDPDRILLEIGPGRNLSTLALRHSDKLVEQVVLTSLRHPQDCQSDVAFLLATLGKLWLTGVEVNWSGFYGRERRHRLPLPTYPFERKRYWVEPLGTNQQTRLKPLQDIETVKQVDSTQFHSRPNLQNVYVAPCNQLEQTIASIWQEFIGIEQIGRHDNFFELGGDSLVATQVIARIQEEFQAELPLPYLFENPSVAGLAEYFETIQRASPSVQAASTIAVVEREEGEI
jgi:acyl transferase domain-containing protein